MDDHNHKSLIIGFLSLAVLIFLGAALFLIPMNKKRSVTIETDPKEVHYKLGAHEGNTPAKLNLKPGDYEIELSKNKYKNKREKFKIKPFGKDPQLSFKLHLEPLNPPKEAVEKGFGGSPDPNRENLQREVNRKYPFYNELPVKERYFYISKPTFDDKFFVYVTRDNPQQGKNDAIYWFQRKGIDNPNSLNIIWQYR